MKHEDLGEATPAVAPIIPFVAGAALTSLIRPPYPGYGYSYNYYGGVTPYPPYPPYPYPPYPYPYPAKPYPYATTYTYY